MSDMLAALAMPALERGSYRARLAREPHDVAAALHLRGMRFREGGRPDVDAFDERAAHMLIEDRVTGVVLGCYRLFLTPSDGIQQGYAGQFYDLTGLSRQGGPMIEMGRFCLHPGCRDPDVLRMAWGALTACVDGCAARFLFGCASFPGLDPASFGDALALLGARHLAPAEWAPGAKAAEVVTLAPRSEALADALRGMAQMPTLLRTYLGMGGRVSDHAVIDREMNTHHVFCAVEIARIPPARQRLLRALLG